MSRSDARKENSMSTYSNLVRHALSAVAALAITAGLLVGSFATAPQRTAVTTVLA
jgi:hypothetical protein